MIQNVEDTPFEKTGIIVKIILTTQRCALLMITICFSTSTQQALERRLAAAIKLNNIHLYRRVHALLLIGEGEAFSDIASSLRLEVDSVYQWFKKFSAQGFSWLHRYHYKGRGRKSKLTQAQKECLYEMIVAGPSANGFDCGIWNTAMIAELIFVKFEVKYNPRYLSTLLRKIGLSYQKARFVSDKQALDEYKKARAKWLKKTWPKLLKQAKDTGAVILFADEVSFAMWGSLARTWAPIGEQPVVQTTGIRKGLKMFGAIEFQGGDFQFMESLSYSLTAKSFKQLKIDALPSDVLKALKSLKGEKYATDDLFLSALEESIGLEAAIQYRDQLLASAEAAGKFNGETYVKFLRQLLDHYTCPVILVEDGAPYHRAKVVKEFVEKNSDRLTLASLPVFSPDFNPIEKLWKNTKRDATHLKYFSTFEELRASVINVFNEYSEDASKVFCVMNKMREQAGLCGPQLLSV